MSRFGFAVVAWLLLALPVVAQPADGEIERETFIHDGLRRYYTVYIPESYDSTESGQLLLVLHGGGGTAQGMFETVGERFNAMMGESNGIVVYPTGHNRRWNDGRLRDDSSQDIDDVGFLSILIEELTDQYQLDNVFIAGFSNGGAMALRAACELPEQVTAVAAVASLYAETVECVPEAPIGVMMVFGDEDPLLPVEGGDIFFNDYPIGTVLSFDDTVGLWLKANDCHESGDAAVLPDDDPDDGTLVQMTAYDDCVVPVQTYLVVGGGHTWPGSALDSDEANFGRTSRDFNATTHIFDYFMSIAES